jgi:coproporphyrinogen III oxidase-like Fe-S oxidoreductase
MGLASRTRLTPREAAQERLLMGLRTDEGVSWDDLAALALGPQHPVVAELARGGWIAPDQQRLVATTAGRRVLDRVTAELATADQAFAHGR